MMKKRTLFAGLILCACMLTACASPAQEPSSDEPQGGSQQENVNPPENGDDEIQGNYTICTDIPADEVEAFAAEVRQEILDRDWTALSEKLTYDIRIGGVLYGSAEEFAAADFDAVVDDDFMAAMEAESCKNMFCTAEGVALGDGQVWIAEVLDIDGNSEGLRVIAINV